MMQHDQRAEKRSSKRKIKGPEHFEVYKTKIPEPSSAQKPRQPPTKNLDPLSKEELLQQVRSKPKAKGDKPPSKKDGVKKRENSTEPRS